jgi:hypothetical protein
MISALEYRKLWERLKRLLERSVQHRFRVFHGDRNLTPALAAAHQMV